MGEFGSRKEIAVGLKLYHSMFAKTTFGETLKDKDSSELNSLKGLIGATDLINKNINNKRTFLDVLDAKKLSEDALFA